MDDHFYHDGRRPSDSNPAGRVRRVPGDPHSGDRYVSGNHEVQRGEDSRPPKLRRPGDSHFHLSDGGATINQLSKGTPFRHSS
jgi:hypothetical protein